VPDAVRTLALDGDEEAPGVGDRNAPDFGRRAEHLEVDVRRPAAKLPLVVHLLPEEAARAMRGQFAAAPSDPQRDSPCPAHPVRTERLDGAKITTASPCGHVSGTSHVSRLIFAPSSLSVNLHQG